MSVGLQRIILTPMRLAIIAMLGCTGTSGSVAKPNPTPPAPTDAPIQIRQGTAVEIDGKLGAEWNDAGSLVLEVEPGWSATIRYKHDGTHLLFAFEQLGRGEEFRYPEILLDVAGDGGMVWEAIA